MVAISFFLIGMMVSFAKGRENEDNLDGLPVPDVDSLSLDEDLSLYRECNSLFDSDSPMLTYCKNNSVCRVIPAPEGHIQTFCDCSPTLTQTHYYMGPQCEIMMPLYYGENGILLAHDSILSVSGCLNTCWLEDLFALNSWKNDFSRVGSVF